MLKKYSVLEDLNGELIMLYFCGGGIDFIVNVIEDKFNIKFGDWFYVLGFFNWVVVLMVG